MGAVESVGAGGREAGGTTIVRSHPVLCAIGWRGVRASNDFPFALAFALSFVIFVGGHLLFLGGGHWKACNRVVAAPLAPPHSYFATRLITYQVGESMTL